MFFSFPTSIPQAVEVGGIPALSMFIRERDETTWARVFNEVIAAGYDLENIVVTDVDPDAYGVMISIANTSSAYPMIVMYDVLGRIYVVMFERFERQVAVEFIRSKLIETAAIEELATISLRVRPGVDRASLSVGFNASDNIDRRSLIMLVSEVTAPLQVTTQLVTFESTESRIVFDISGPEYERALEAVRAALNRGYRNMITEVKRIADVTDAPEPEAQPNVVQRVIARLLGQRAEQVEEAGVFEAAEAMIGDRVVVNDGTGAEPMYYLGTVTALLRIRAANGRTLPRIKVMLDNGREITEAIDNSAAGLLGFSSSKRRKLDPIRPEHVHGYLSRSRWLSSAAQTMLENNQ